MGGHPGTVTTVTARDGQILAFSQYYVPRQGPCSILSVGWESFPYRNQRPRPIRSTICHVGYDVVDGALLKRLAPLLIVSPVIGDGFDCLDLARRLDALGYDGRYRAIALLRYDVGLVEADIARCCPGIDFGVVVPPAEIISPA